MLAVLAQYRSAVSLAVALALVAALAVQTVRLDGAVLRMQAAQAETKSLQVQLSIAESRLAAIASDAEARAQAAQQAVEAANKLSARATQRAAAIRAAKTPASCPDAIQFLVQDAAGATP